jgi:putative acetyltransferase
VSAQPPIVDAPEAQARARREEDWAALLDLWVAAWRATYPDIDFGARRDWLKAHLLALETGGAATVVLAAPEGLAGFVTVHPHSCWLDQLCVAPARFGRGDAQALMAAARRLSPERIALDVNADNARALNFYESEGFRTLGPGKPSLSGRATLLLEWRRAGAMER